MHPHFPLRRPLLAAALALAGAAAQAASFQFSQHGFAGGATLNGHFSGTDLDGDGWLYGYEITDFALRFSGSFAVPAFSHQLSDLNGLEYQLGTATLSGLASNFGGSEGFVVASYQWPTYHLAGVVTDLASGISSQTDHAIAISAVSAVSAVPEPSRAALILGGLGVVTLLGRRQFRRG